VSSIGRVEIDGVAVRSVQRVENQSTDIQGQSCQYVLVANPNKKIITVSYFLSSVVFEIIIVVNTFNNIYIILSILDCLFFKLNLHPINRLG